MKSFTISNKGKRPENQDKTLSLELNSNSHLYIIADGMGGYERGEEAAEIVTESISTFLATVNNIDSEQIQKAVNKANLAIRQLSHSSAQKIGSTVGGIAVFQEQAICFWVGDVRIFHFKNKKLLYESKPHTLMNEIVQNGSITNTEQVNRYRHVVTRSIQGDLSYSNIDFKEFNNLTPDDLFVICSDGVTDIFEGIQIQQIINNCISLESSANELEKRLSCEAKDNYSFILIQADIET